MSDTQNSFYTLEFGDVMGSMAIRTTTQNSSVLLNNFHQNYNTSTANWDPAQ